MDDITRRDRAFIDKKLRASSYLWKSGDLGVSANSDRGAGYLQLEPGAVRLHAGFQRSRDLQCGELAECHPYPDQLSARVRYLPTGHHAHGRTHKDS